MMGLVQAKHWRIFCFTGLNHHDLSWCDVSVAAGYINLCGNCAEAVVNVASLSV
jgi:hypothetical protein